jgi:propionyl-CoA carboxylase alpha chain
MIKRVLVANRGEIARRIFATCRAIGIETVAVYSDADEHAPHVREADRAVRLPGNSPAATYLRIDLLISAAQRARADAIHPGYGFLAENADFAEACIDAGLTWIGPPPKAIALMGNKLEAKALLADAGIAMLPTHRDPADVAAFPVLVKAAAGGGGRGMRVVRDAAGLIEAVASARREASSAFGDGTVFCERYVDGARHIEVQVLADTQGAVIPLGERECSIQRRHQKIVEEAPSPAVSDDLRERLFHAAGVVAQAVGYVGAGTVEFLLAPSGEFYFLEMNTRLQVEHPVTELTTGVDLVRLQLLVAEGEPVPFPAPPAVRGHAIEVRLCAEDPGNAWRPSTGTLHRFRVPDVSGRFRLLRAPGLRLDSGVEEGTVIGVHYDSLLAKVIAWAPTRHEAARLLSAALAKAQIHGVVTNRDLLVRTLRHPAFLAGTLDTAFLDRYPELRAPLVSTLEAAKLSCLAAALAATARRRHNGPLSSIAPGWRNVGPAFQTVAYAAPTGPVEVAYRFDRAGALAAWSVRPIDHDAGAQVPEDLAAIAHEHPTVAVVTATADRVELEVMGIRHRFFVNQVDGVSFVDSADGSVALPESPRFPPPRSTEGAGSLMATMPGTVTRVHVTAGDPVTAGDLLITLEAMKLEHPIYAPVAGTVESLPVTAGSQVDTGTVLVVIAPN